MNQPSANSNLVALIDGLILFGEFALLALGHIFPWHLFPALVSVNGKKELHRLVAYVYGVGCIWLGCVVYSIARSVLGLTGDIPIGFMTAVIIAASVGTTLPRCIKVILERVAVRRSNRAKHGR